MTAAHEGERGVFTANWLSQASFEPPLVIAPSRTTVDPGSSAAAGALQSVPSTKPEGAGRGARSPKARAGDKFATLELAVVDTESGVPALAESLGYVVCNVRSESPAGDSVVFIGEVVEARSFSDAPPLEMRVAGFRHAG